MNTDIKTIDESGLLSSDHIRDLQAVSGSIKAGFNRRQRFRPKFLMETAVLNDMKFPTPDAKYWQCTVERDVHFRNLLMLSYDYREKQADILILEESLNNITLTPGETMKTQIKCERENALLVYMEKEAQERTREILSWSEIMDGLAPNLKYDPEDIEAHMPEAFAIRYAREQEVMKLTSGQSDMSGAMNIVSIGKTIGQHEEVEKLIGGDK